MTWEPWGAVALLAGYGLWAAKDRIQAWREPEPLEKVHQKYRRGKIDETELERRLDYLMDDRNEQIRQHVEQVGGIGEVTAKEVALSFESVYDLREADRDDLEAVPNVGPKRAKQIAERFD